MSPAYDILGVTYQGTMPDGASFAQKNRHGQRDVGCVRLVNIAKLFAQLSLHNYEVYSDVANFFVVNKIHLFLLTRSSSSPLVYCGMGTESSPSIARGVVVT